MISKASYEQGIRSSLHLKTYFPEIMHCWRGVLVHMCIILTQPIYLTLKIVLGTAHSGRVSPVWLAIHAIIYFYTMTRFTIPFFTSPLRRMPSPPEGRFPFGHLDFNSGKPMTDNIAEKFKSTPNDGILVLWFPFYLSCELLITRPEMLMEMLNTHNYDWEKPTASKKFLSRTIGQGLVNAEGDAHKTMRRVVAPAFSGHYIRNLAGLFHTKGLAFADSMAERIKESADGTLEMMSQMSLVTLDIIGSAGVGKDFDTIHNNDDPFAKLYATITDTDRGPLVLFFMIQAFVPRWIVRCFPGTVYARVATAQDQLRVETRALMREKRQKMEDKTQQEDDIISVILRSGEFSDDYLVGQLLTFLAAGHDTTASALTWVTWLLATHPETQDRLRTECKAHFPSPKADDTRIDPSLFDSQTTPYLNAVCLETLRLYPTVPITVRVSAKPTTLGQYHIPAGTRAAISPWAINRDPTLWGPDAETFNPDRWIEGKFASNGGANTPYAMLTFLHGPRSCIGRGFALLEMKCLLAVLVGRFRFEVAEKDQKVEVGGFVTIKPHGGLRLRVVDLRKDNNA